MKYTISARRFAIALTLLVILLSLVSFAGQIAKFIYGHDQLFGIVPLFDVGDDLSVPSWYSASALLFAAALLLLIGSFKRRSKDSYAKFWLGLSLIFLLLSLDETSGIHEKAGNLLEGTMKFTGVFYYAWILLGIGFVILIGISYLRFLWSLPSVTRAMFILSGAIFVGGALGMEAISSWYDYRFGKENIRYSMLTAVEEFMEMIGIVLFIYALLRYIQAQNIESTIEVGDW